MVCRLCASQATKQKRSADCTEPCRGAKFPPVRLCCTAFFSCPHPHHCRMHGMSNFKVHYPMTRMRCPLLRSHSLKNSRIATAVNGVVLTGSQLIRTGNIYRQICKNHLPTIRSASAPRVAAQSRNLSALNPAFIYSFGLFGLGSLHPVWSSHS